MAVVRISQPGVATRFLDVGPSVGRPYGTRIGGSLVTAQTPANVVIPSPYEVRREAARKAARTPRPDRELCGRVMKSGAVCARSLGHGYDHRSRQWLDRQAAAVRA